MTKNDERELGSSPSLESQGPAQPDGTYQPIPVAAAKQIAEAFAKNWVVILAGDEAHHKLHTVTYGRSPAEKVAAASIGEFLAKALGSDLKQSQFFEDFRAMPAAHARAELEAEVAKRNLMGREKGSFRDASWLPLEPDSSPPDGPAWLLVWQSGGSFVSLHDGVSGIPHNASHYMPIDVPSAKVPA